MTASDDSDQAKVGVVVIGRNERPRLELSLSSIPGGIPVVYADSNSDDGSREIAEELGADVVALSTDRQMTAARGRNAGAHRLLALHPDIAFIQFIDGDCELDPGWIQQGSRFLVKQPEVAVVCGRRSEIDPGASTYNRLCDIEWNTPVGQAESSGGDSMVRAKAFTEVGGFRDEQLAHEEPEFCARLRDKGWKVWRIDHPMTRHDAAISRLGQFYRRGKRGGAGMCQVVTRKDSPTDGAARQILRRAFFWAAFLPVVGVLGILIDWRVSAAVLLIYALQWLRQSIRAMRAGFAILEGIKVGALSIIAKFAETHGAIEFILRYRAGTRNADLSY